MSLPPQIPPRANSGAKASAKQSSSPAASLGGAGRANQRPTGQRPVGKGAPARKGASKNSTRPANRGGSKGPKSKRKLWNYPRAGKGKIRRWLPSWQFVLCSILFVLTMGIGTLMLAYATTDVPAPNDFAKAQTTVVYYDDSKTEMGRFTDINRTVIDTTKLPSYVGNAVVASEDSSFYSNNGIDPKGIVRALFNNLTGGPIQGASTLTQQYVKNYYVDTTDSYVGKLKQAFLAVKIDQSQSKQKILGNYLNTIYYGRGAYGVEEASKAYFGHSADKLTLSEAALLSAVIPAPSGWDPAVNAKTSQAKWTRVADLMLKQNFITAAQRAEMKFPKTIEPTTKQVYAGTKGYLLQMVRTELKAKMKLTDEQIDTGGFKVTTTINQKDQEAAVNAVHTLPSDKPAGLGVALTSIDPRTGAIVALYGGEDYLKSQVNSATQAVAQAGSTYKPFALVTALNDGMTLSDGYMGTSPMTIEGHEFQNFQDVSYGWVNLVKATAFSINTPYLQLNKDIGPENTNKTAIAAGYPANTLGFDDTTQGVLGSVSPHNIDIARAYSTFAAQGQRHDIHIVGKVSSSTNTVVYTANTTGQQVFKKEVMADVTYALTQVVQLGSGETAKSLNRPVAAKTGSSSDNKSAQFVGYTPQLVTAVTLFQQGADGSEQSITPFGNYSEITGSTYPADIFTNYMGAALDGQEVLDFPERSDESYSSSSRGGSSSGGGSSNGGGNSDQNNNGGSNGGSNGGGEATQPAQSASPVPSGDSNGGNGSGNGNGNGNGNGDNGNGNGGGNGGGSGGGN